MSDLFVGIDNGKHGAIAIIDEDKNILDVFKYDSTDTTKFFNLLIEYRKEHRIYAFIEKPIVVYGLAHQTSPFETIGRHKMTLEILKIPYEVGDPAATSPNNWKKIIGLFDDAKAASKANTKEISALNKKAKELKEKAEDIEVGGSEKIVKDKIAYMDPELAKIAEEFRSIKKQIGSLRKDKKHSVKQTSVEACLKMFPDSEKYILKSGRATKNKYDDDIAEAILLAECGRVTYGTNKSNSD